MVKPLTFKGDKKYSKKRKAPTTEAESFPPKLEKAVILAEEADRLNEDDSWVTAEVPTDIVGPIVFALPSIPPTCIACDANGKIFTSELENMVDGNAATAEPHDVRQVWVASRVSGTDNISFKGHHQRYVGVLPTRSPKFWCLHQINFKFNMKIPQLRLYRQPFCHQ